MPSSSEEFRKQLIATFKEEAREILETFQVDLGKLDGSASAASSANIIDTLFRGIHTLKGAARSVGQTDMEALCQAAEVLLSALSRARRAPDSRTVALLAQTAREATRLLLGTSTGTAQAALIAQLGASLAAPAGSEPTRSPKADQMVNLAATPAPATTEQPAIKAQPDEPRPRDLALGEPEFPTTALTVQPADTSGVIVTSSPEANRPALHTLRVGSVRLDELMAQAEELHLPRLAAEVRTSEAISLLSTLQEVRRQLANDASRAADQSPAGRGRFKASGLGAIETQVRLLVDRLRSDSMVLNSAVGGVLEKVREMRMVPAASILGAFPTMVEDLASSLGKVVSWNVEGGDLQLDRNVLETIKDAILHLVRNAIDHGIEPAEVRQAAGKPVQARVIVRFALREGGRVAVNVEDDGRGLDLDTVRSAAVRLRIVDADSAQKLSDEQVADLIFRSGLSTSPVVGALSGNGMGLAIVRERAERFDGLARVSSSPGLGTSFTMLVPLSAAMHTSVLVRIGAQTYLLPGDAVERAISVDSTAFGTSNPTAFIQVGGVALPAAHVADILGVARNEMPQARAGWPALVMHFEDRRAVFLVDEILGQHDVLLKDFSAPLKRVRNVAAAGLLGSGDLILSLRVADLFRSMRAGLARRPERPAAQRASHRRTIMVVDDSVTTRSMERNLLEAAGFDVRTAVDGMDAWSQLRVDPVDLVVSDVDMPRMDGFELTRRIRADARMADLPVVLVTALEARVDKERGIEVGANAYVIKSAFDQGSLLQIVNRLV